MIYHAYLVLVVGDVGDSTVVSGDCVYIIQPFWDDIVKKWPKPWFASQIFTGTPYIRKWRLVS